MTLTSPSGPPEPGYTRHRVTLEEFEALYVENPRFAESRFELLEGEIYDMTTMGDEHVGALGHLSYELILKLLGRARVLSQVPLSVRSDSRPEPDFIVVREASYSGKVPQASEVSAVLELSLGALELDRTRKESIYARAGVPEYWIVNLVEGQLEVYREPMGQHYRQRLLYTVGEEVSFLEFPDVPVRWWG